MTREPSKDYIRSYLGVAQEVLEDAETMLQRGRLRTSLDRSYYAMFHAAQALLLHRGFPLPKSHHAVISLFGREVARKGVMTRESGRILAQAFDLRRAGTYDVDVELDSHQIALVVERARWFVGEVEKVMGANLQPKEGESHA
ncbi:MAG: HEPN domain-containing protein [Chloroflexi bacterium]|nr:HEPN domain-containing protein [Chloroflexota bacterium]